MPPIPEPNSNLADASPPDPPVAAEVDGRDQSPSWLSKNLRWLGPLCIANVVLLIVLIGGPALRQHYVLQTLRSTGVEFATHEVGPKWLRDWIGYDRMQTFETIYVIQASQLSIPIIIENRPLFNAVEFIRIKDTAPSAASLKLLLGDPANEPAFHGLRGIWARHVTLADEHLACFAHCRSLTWLDLEDTRTTGNGLRHLSELTRMRQLFLNDNEIDGAHIQHLSQMNELIHLRLGRTKVDDRSLAVIGEISSLEAIELYETNVTDAGVAELAKLPKLQMLLLGGTNVTDISADILSRSSTLEHLHLSSSKLSDAGLKKLAGLLNLRYLQVDEASTTTEGEAAFHRIRQEAGLPECELIR